MNKTSSLSQKQSLTRFTSADKKKKQNKKKNKPEPAANNRAHLSTFRSGAGGGVYMAYHNQPPGGVFPLI